MGDIQYCENSKFIKLMLHTINICERITERRSREEINIGFIPGRDTTGALFAVRQPVEKHLEKQKGPHIVCIDV